MLVNRMNRILLARFSFILLCGVGLAACGSDNDKEAGEASTTDSLVHSKPATADARLKKSPGKPSPPIKIDYEILGQPIVGIPLSINVRVSSPLEQPIAVNYRINDSTGLMFTEAQAERVSLVPIGDEAFSAEQVTVIPQREGRLFLNVSAEIETEIGMMARVMAIPIQVGAMRPAPQLNGELTTGEEGEALISMPAKEE